jgi:hypothetical protein
MGTQRHVIKRQIVEITLAKKDHARQLQQTLSRILQQQLPPLLEQCLSEASSPDCLHRIDRLELDLGELDARYLEAELPEKIEAALRQALVEHINPAQALPFAQQQNDPLPAHLELFEHFVREGYLPWWADSGQRHAPEHSLSVLLNNGPEALKRLLLRLIQEPRCLQRLTGYFNDDCMILMIALLTGAPRHSAASLLQTLSAVLAPLHQHSGMPVSQLKATLRQSLLQVASASSPVISRHGEFLTAATLRWAGLQDLPRTVLAGCLQQLAADKSALDSQWLQAIRLSGPEEHALATRAGASNGKRPAILDRRRPMPSSTPASEPSTEGQAANSLDSPIAYPRRIALTAIGNRYPMLKKSAGHYSGQTPKITNEPVTEDRAIKQPARELARTSRFDEQTAKNNGFPHEDQAIIEITNTKPTAGDSDAVYINNAGLCLLWPFLGAFFERLELVQNDRFTHPAAKQCAVGLLHYVSTGELNPPEYLLPFNKLLCAMAIDEVFDLTEPPTAVQIDACDELLSAVIANAPVLNDMSINGFRGSFLLRRGSLGAGDGSWLVRVERETYDLVLERFPWSWQWFKLPWMEHPLRVEW